MSTVFRSPSTQTETPTEIKPAEPITSPVEGEKPPTLYREHTSKPFLARVLDVEGTYNHLDEPTRLNMDDIDEYYNESVKSGAYDNSANGYKEFWKELVRKVGAQHAPMKVQLGKVKEFIGYLKRAKEYERQ